MIKKKLTYIVFLIITIVIPYTVYTETNSITNTLEDIEGNIYNTIKIGNQVWTKENLKTTKYNDGTAILNVTDSAQWRSIETPAYCWYDNNIDNKNKYGALYNWYAVKTGKLAPKGWHVPTDAEWTELEEYLIVNGYNWDGSTNNIRNVDRTAKSLAAQTDWKTDTTTGSVGSDLKKNNRSGFSALPGGCRDAYKFWEIGERGYWWSASEGYLNEAFCREIFSYGGLLSKDDYKKIMGFSVRLIKDSN